VLFFFIGCVSSDQSETNPTNKSANEIETDNNILKTDTAIVLEIVSDTAYFLKGNSCIAKSFLQGEKTDISKEGDKKTIKDKAFLFADCMIILRNIQTAGEFCHIPEIDKAEIYTALGDTIMIEKGRKQTISGATLTEVFNGNRHESPAKKWGMIFNEAEGMIFGFMIIRSDGSYIYTETGNEYSLSYGEKLNTGFTNDDKFVLFDCVNDNKSADFIIYSSGKFEVINK